jgi:hypothetical protein
MLIFFLVVLAISIAASLLIRPQMPKTTDQKFEAPTTEIGKSIPVLFGTREISEPRLVWSGNIRIVKVDVDMGGK